MPHVNDLVTAAIPNIAGDNNAIQDKLTRFYVANGAAAAHLEDERISLLVALNQVIVFGANQINDSFFANTAVWTKGTGWTVAGGRATVDGTQVGDSFLTYNAGNMAAGLTRITISITAVANGFLELQVNGVVISTPLSTTGLSRIDATLAAGAIRVRAPAGVTGQLSLLAATAVTTVGPGPNKYSIQDLWENYLRVNKGYTGALDDMRPAYWLGALP